MLVEELWNEIRLVFKKERRGSLRDSDIETAINIACKELYADLLKEFRTGRVLPASLDPFRASTNIDFAGNKQKAFTGVVAQTWVTTTDYVIGDLVINSGTTYVCLIDHTAGTFSTDLGAGNWAVYSYSSIAEYELISATSAETSAAWVGATSYSEGDVVVYGSAYYICITAHTSDASDFTNDAANWESYANPDRIGIIYNDEEWNDIVNSALLDAGDTFLRKVGSTLESNRTLSDITLNYIATPSVWFAYNSAVDSDGRGTTITGTTDIPFKESDAPRLLAKALVYLGLPLQSPDAVQVGAGKDR